MFDPQGKGKLKTETKLSCRKKNHIFIPACFSD